MRRLIPLIALPLLLLSVAPAAHAGCDPNGECYPEDCLPEDLRPPTYEQIKNDPTLLVNPPHGCWVH